MQPCAGGENHEAESTSPACRLPPITEDMSPHSDENPLKKGSRYISIVGAHGLCIVTSTTKGPKL